MKSAKERHIEFLERVLCQQEEMRLDAEINYRGLTSILLGQSKADTQALIAQTKMKELKDNLDVKIRRVRELLEEVKNGEFVI